MAEPVRLRRLATSDVDDAVDQILADACAEVAARYVDDVERALLHLGRLPHSGSLRFADDLDIPALRAWPLERFPYLVFHLERDD